MNEINQKHKNKEIIIPDQNLKPTAENVVEQSGKAGEQTRSDPSDPLFESESAGTSDGAAEMSEKTDLRPDADGFESGASPAEKSEPAERIRQLLEVQKGIRNCRHCRETFGFEPHPVQWGHPHARIMQISQAPSRKVHESGLPFSDPSGDRLRHSWYQISDEQFYNKDNFYITTMGHCFPGKSGRGNYDNKPPKCCYDMWTSKEIELMDNAELYLIVGGEAASRIFPKQKLSDLVFQDLTLHGKPCFVLPHPSPLNMRWFRQHPEFEEQRLPVIRRKIHEVLDLPASNVVE